MWVTICAYVTHPEVFLDATSVRKTGISISFFNIFKLRILINIVVDGA